MELTLNFEKRFISRSVGKMLQENLPPNEVETLNRIVAGKKAQYKEANSLLYYILRAIENRGEEEELEFTIMGNNDQEQECSQESTQQEDTEESDGAGVETSSKSPASLTPIARGIPKSGPKVDRMEGAAKVGADTAVCKFYGNGKCKFSSECRYRHPKICQKFRHHGDTTLDKRGCDGKCGEFHPNVCRSSLRSKTCTYRECRFYHIRGTKTIERENRSEPNERSVSQKQGSKQTSKPIQKKSFLKQQQGSNKNGGNFVSKNRFSVLSQDMDVSQPVFCREKDNLDTTLQQIMRELADIRSWQRARTEQAQPNPLPLFRPQAPAATQAVKMPMIPQPSQTNSWSTQDQHLAWRTPSY